MTMARAGEHKAIGASPSWLPAQRQPGPGVPRPPAPRPPAPRPPARRPVPPPPRPPVGPFVEGFAAKPVGRPAPGGPPGVSRTGHRVLPVLTPPVPQRRNWKSIAAITALVVALAGLVVFSAFASPGIDGTTLAPRDPAPAVSVPDGGSGGLLPRADGVQAAADGTARQARAAITPASAPPESALAHIASIVVLGLAVPLAAVAALTMWGMLSAWHTPASGRGGSFTRRTASRPRIFSLMLPARFAGRALATTIEALATQQHDSFEVLVIVGHDDPQTFAVARAAASRFPARVRVITDHSATKDRPTVLNAALQHCLGELIAVFRVGEQIRPGMLRAIEARFEETGAGIVQAGVRPVRFRPTWWALRDGVERYFRFGSSLQAHAQQRFVPLDETLVVIRAAVLRGFGGWHDRHRIAGCELGVQLTSSGCRVAVAYDPVVAALQVAPDSVAQLVEQRSVACRAELQELRDGRWMALPGRGQRLLARCLPRLPFLQAGSLVLTPLLLALTLIAGAPLGIVLLSLLPLVPVVVGTAVEAAGLRDSGRACGIEVGFTHYVKLVLGAIPYQALLAMAAVRAIGRAPARADSRVAFR